MTRNPDSMHSPPRVQTRRLGDFTLHSLEAGTQRLDGGAMFGVVPKPLWEKRIPADERNRIPLGLRCLLVETRGRAGADRDGAGEQGEREVPRHLRRGQRVVRSRASPTGCSS